MANGAGGSPTQESFYGTWKDDEGYPITITADTYRIIHQTIRRGEVKKEEEITEPIVSWKAVKNEYDDTKAEYPSGFEIVTGGLAMGPRYINSDCSALCGYDAVDEDGENPFILKKVPSCPSCGMEVKPGAKFCSGCGAKTERICASCGQKLDPGHGFCPNCGTKA